ncbi:MAG: DUF4190 domain-containing protein [Oscillospiraceae bacterium]|jgi:hypothetical protein|nr:DUF4190 domain-containing protein [Oscillospiraceae bacterium]
MSKKEYAPVFTTVNRSKLPPEAVVLPMPEKNIGLKADGFAIASLVLGILSCTICLFIFSFPLSLTGLILGISALVKRTDRKGNAIAGLILSLVALLSSIAGLIAFFSIIVDWIARLVNSIF